MRRYRRSWKYITLMIILLVTIGFAVLTAGLLLGKKYGTLSQVLYIGLGATLIPWFAGATGGLEVLFGSTCGLPFASLGIFS